VHNIKGIKLVLRVKYMKWSDNSLHCFLITFLGITKMSLHILANYTFELRWVKN